MARERRGQPAGRTTPGDVEVDVEVDVEADPRNPFVFVVGCPRSGTTLLQRMLDSHPLLAVANDTHFVARCLEKLAPGAIEHATRGADVPLDTELAAGVRGYHRFPRLGVGATEAEQAARASRTYQEYVSALYTAFARGNGKPLGGEKTPDYVRHLPLLHGMFPQARTVHILRDGRDVALSLLDWARADKGPGRLDLWREEPVGVAALWWRWQVREGRESGARLGRARYLELAYDDLVAGPETSLRRISRFLGLPFAPEMLAYHAGKERSGEELSAKRAWLPPTRGLRDWRTQMPPRDIALFEVLAGDLLEELGHRRAGGAPSPAVRDAASRCAGWWQAHLERRERKRRTRRLGS